MNNNIQIKYFLLLMVGLFIGFSLGRNYPNNEILYKNYEYGSYRSAIYTYEHKQLPSMFFRYTAFKYPNLSDKEIDIKGEEYNIEFNKKYKIKLSN